MERTGPTGVVDVPMKLFPDTAAVLLGIDGIDVEIVVWRGNCQMFPMVYVVVRSKGRFVVEPELDVNDEISALFEACFFRSSCEATGCLSLSIFFLRARFLPAVLLE
jgi:hypothetical protein